MSIVLSCVLQFAVKLLELAILAQDKDASSPFHICGIVIPKLVSMIVNFIYRNTKIRHKATLIYSMYALS